MSVRRDALREPAATAIKAQKRHVCAQEQHRRRIAALGRIYIDRLRLWPIQSILPFRAVAPTGPCGYIARRVQVGMPAQQTTAEV
jgi:hypothetical protein